MSKNQYNAPAIEVVEFGKEDMVCDLSRFDVITPGGDNVGGGDIITKPEGRICPSGGAIRTKYVSTLGASAQVDAPFHSL